ncbi:MAG: NAD(P)/FAD-dependent oxidoreductase [Peptococcaceae bacterium]|jgi:2,4-dienoyl-CoA reductase-like NADH-dependent reductase (Old Yellow Enzyme family)/thioredoxin reductase|nr:NAD(P)/FAD-dependent oxidoreductase [Peptococcaceae bacterium]
MFDLLFQPFQIGSLKLKNRLCISAMETCYCDIDGKVTPRYIAYMEARAKGGWGLITTELTAISIQGRAFFNCLGLWDDAHIEGNKKLVDTIHKNGAKICIQLGHGGRQTGKLEAEGEPVAPSSLPDPTRANKPEDVPRELTVKEIKRIIDDFAQAARRAKAAGYDAIEIHGAHGYLIQQFLSPFSNKRTDEYGGSLRNRARFALEVIAAIRQQVGPDYPLIYRISTTEMMDGARLNIGDTRAFCLMLEEAGIDAINASVGSHATKGFFPVCPNAIPRAYNIDYAEEIKKVVSIPVIGNGRINDPYIAESILRSGKVDLIAMGRSSLADPELPKKVKEGRIDEINYCVGCMQGCIGNLKRGCKPIQCLVNPILGQESEYTWRPANASKKVAVIGGGIAGMGAAIAAARRGHRVTLYEKSSKLGGQWLLAAVGPFKQECTTLTVWQKSQLQKLGVEIHLNTEIREDTIEAGYFDTIIIATGAVPLIPAIPGVDLPHVTTAAEILGLRINPGKRVVVVGGGQVGAETAAFLASQDKDVTILEMMDNILREGEPGVNYYLKKSLDENGVTQLVKAKVLRIEEHTVFYEQEGEIKTITEVDNVVIAVGSRSANQLGEKLKGMAQKVVMVGDAIQPGKGLDAYAEGFRAGYYA